MEIDHTIEIDCTIEIHHIAETNHGTTTKETNHGTTTKETNHRVTTKEIDHIGEIDHEITTKEIGSIVEIDCIVGIDHETITETTTGKKIIGISSMEDIEVSIENFMKTCVMTGT